MPKRYRIIRKLRSYKGENGQQVLLRVRMNDGFETEIPVYDFVNYEKHPITVFNHHWNKGKVTGGRYHKSVNEINAVIYKVRIKLEMAIDELKAKNITINRQNLIKHTYEMDFNQKEEDEAIAKGEIIVDEDGGAFGSEEEFIEFITNTDDPRYADVKREYGIKRYILDYWDEFIRDFAPDSYNGTKIPIGRYIKETGDNCKATEFSSIWLERFFKHIIKEGYSLKKDGKEKQHYSISTIYKHLKHLKRFGDYLFREQKVLDNEDYKRFRLKTSTKKKSILKYDPNPYNNAHALQKIEFDDFYFFKFNDKTLDIVRDMFVLQTWLGGLRISDFLGISDHDIYKDAEGRWRIWLEQQKTEVEVHGVINNHYVQSILDKYDGKFDIFPNKNDYNEKLKEAAKVAGLNRMLRFRIEYAKDEKATIERFPIHSKIANKWARNCAVSILCELGFPDDRIAKFTGHRDKKMIEYYKTVHGKDVKAMIDEVKPEKVGKSMH